MNAIAWPWQHHRRALDTLRREVQAAAEDRRAAEQAAVTAKRDQQAALQGIHRADQVAADTRDALAENHFTELLRAAMRRRE